MLGMIRSAIVDLYTVHIGVPVEWSDRETNLFFDRVSQHLEGQAYQLGMELRTGAIQQWTRRHGDHPDYLTTVQLSNTALMNAAEAVVREWAAEHTVPDIEEDPKHPPAVTGVPWGHRWCDPRYRSEPSDAMTHLANEVWPPETFSATFRALGTYVLATRLEDGLPLPDGPRDSLAAELFPDMDEHLSRLGFCSTEPVDDVDEDQLFLFTGDDT